jgi:hypothetical protein
MNNAVMPAAHMIQEYSKSGRVIEIKELFIVRCSLFTNKVSSPPTLSIPQTLSSHRDAVDV